MTAHNLYGTDGVTQKSTNILQHWLFKASICNQKNSILLLEETCLLVIKITKLVLAWKIETILEEKKKLICRPVVVLVITGSKQFYNGQFIHMYTNTNEGVKF